MQHNEVIKARIFPKIIKLATGLLTLKEPYGQLYDIFSKLSSAILPHSAVRGTAFG
jgi:hypothetical protein